jgi:hypothetical protein
LNPATRFPAVTFSTYSADNETVDPEIAAVVLANVVTDAAKDWLFVVRLEDTVTSLEARDDEAVVNAESNVATTAAADELTVVILVPI